ncbi:MAG: MAPEG family protein [Caulobacteraceae bacterium]
MEHYKATAIVSLLALLLYVWMGLRVGQGRGKHGIDAPAMTGHPDFERLVRIQTNTLEWLPIFLVSLWLFALYWSPALSEKVAAAVGLVWIIGRFLYMTGYTRAAGSRSTGFLVQMVATAVLLFGALGRIVWLVATRG